MSETLKPGESRWDHLPEETRRALEAACRGEERFKVDQLLRRLGDIATGLRFNGQDQHADDVDEAVDLIEELRGPDEDG